MPRKKKIPGAVTYDDPVITVAKLKVLLKTVDKKMKEHDLPEDIEAIVERYQKARNALRHARAEAKASWNRLVEKCEHKEGKNPPALPEGWVEGTGPRCKYCGCELQEDGGAPATEILAADNGGAERKAILDKMIDELVDEGRVADLESMATLQAVRDGTAKPGSTINVNIKDPDPSPADVSQPDFGED